MLGTNFQEFDIKDLPANVDILKASSPTGWSAKVGDLMLRSMSFNECEMISNPLVIMTVVSSMDIDPIACMQELASPHHTPSAVLSGQYDPATPRVYVNYARVCCMLYV